MSVSEFVKKCWFCSIEILDQNYNSLIIADCKDKQLIDLYGDCEVSEISTYKNSDIIGLIVLEAI